MLCCPSSASRPSDAIAVTDPLKLGDGVGAYVCYKVRGILHQRIRGWAIMFVGGSTVGWWLTDPLKLGNGVGAYVCYKVRSATFLGGPVGGSLCLLLSYMSPPSYTPPQPFRFSAPPPAPPRQ